MDEKHQDLESHGGLDDDNSRVGGTNVALMMKWASS